MTLITSTLSCALAALVAMPVFSSQETVHLSKRITDEQIIGIITAVDESEISAANIAKTKSTSLEVSRYARYLHKQHLHNLSSLKNLEHETGLSPMKSAQFTAITKDSRSEASMLTPLNGRAFESAYIDSMVKGHAGGLKLINTVLLKEVTNVKLKKFIENFRTLVTRHLEKGEKIQKNR